MGIVAGDRLPGSIAGHILRCEALILAEQSKPCPDNAIVAALCDSVRLAREHVAFAMLERPAPEQKVTVLHGSASGDCECFCFDSRTDEERTANLARAYDDVERHRSDDEGRTYPSALLPETARNGTRGTFRVTVEFWSGEGREIIPPRAPSLGQHKCPSCGKWSRNETAGCDHCDLEDK